MIVRPRRSVTRFFVPLIDVLILLFCIFLLMPLVSRPDETDPTVTERTPESEMSPRTEREAREEVERLKRRVAELERDLAEARRARPELAEKIVVKVLEIDPASGELYHFDPDRRTLRTQADAQRLIDQVKREARLRDPFFLIVYPRRISGFPTLDQINAYRRWFDDVDHGFDNPRAGG